MTSVTQFPAFIPPPLGYQALSNLVETYGCVASYPNGTFRGNRAMTRYEAAALREPPRQCHRHDRCEAPDP